MKNLSIKFLSVILASIFWFALVISKQNINEIPQFIPISVVNISEDQNLSNILPKIKLKVDAPLDVFKLLDSSDFKAIIDAKGLYNGEFEKEIIVSSKNSKVRIVSYSPKSVKIKLEGYSTKKVPVKLNVTGQANKNYNITYAQFKEKYITISAANSILNKINEVNIKYNLEGDDSDIIKKITPVLYDENGNILDIIFDPKFLNLEIRLERIQIVKSIGVNPVFVGKLKDNLKIEYIKVEPSLVKLIGTEEKLKNLFSINTEDIDLGNLNFGNKIINKKLSIPGDIYGEVTNVKIIIKISDYTINNN